jgi:adenylate cyclase
MRLLRAQNSKSKMQSLWKRLNHFGQRQSVFRRLLIIPIVTTAMIIGSELGIFRILEWALTDQFYSMRLSGEQFKGLNRFAIVTIDEADITSLQQWPMTDEVMLTLFQNIFQQDPVVVGMNIYRDLPVEPGHAQLRQWFTQTPNFFGIEQILPPPIAPPPALAPKGQVSASDLIVDRDGNIRRGILTLTKPNGRVVESLGTYAALRYLEQQNIHLEEIDRYYGIYQLGKMRFTALTGEDSLYTPEETGHAQDVHQSQILLHYLAKLEHFPRISFREVLSNEIPPNFFKDRIVLIGSKAPSLNDNYRTPLNNSIWYPADLMPGIIIHANMTAQIIDAALNDRPFLQRPQAEIDYLWILFWTMYGTLVGLLYIQYRWLTWGLIGLGGTIAGGIAYLLFLHGWLILVFTPILALVLSSAISLLSSLWDHLNQSYQALAHQRDLLQDANTTLKKLNDKYSRFVPFEYLKFLERDSILDLELGDHTICKMAILFSDIRNFTSMSEIMTPQNTFNFVNGYLQQVSPEIRNYGGIVVKFMGDGILAIFPGNTDNCIKAAIAQQKKLIEYNIQLKEKGFQPIHIGIGIHVGNAMLGVIGEESRMQGDVLSDAVNLASRLESLTKHYGSSIIISGDTLKDLENPDHYHTRLLDQVVVKGRSKPISIFEVVDGESNKSSQLKKVCQSTFDQGLTCYFQQDFSQAYNHFSRVLSINPNDVATQLYLDRITYLRTHGVPDNWHGVWYFEDK